MKKITSLAILVAMAIQLEGKAQQEPIDAVGKWLIDRTNRAAKDDFNMERMYSPSPGSYRVIKIAELDAPDAVKAHFRTEIARGKGGVARVAVGTIPSVPEMLARLPKVKRSDAILRERLPSPPTNLAGTALGAAELIGMDPSGALDGLKSSGLTRYYRLPDVGIIDFNEENYLASGMQIEVFEEAQNVRVNGVPAQLDKRIDGQGRGQVHLSWPLKGKAFSLTATGDGDVEHQARVLQEIASGIKD